MKNGFILIDKEKSVVSFKLVSALRQRAGQKAVGFAGTLDPLASGLMVLALGECTKLLQYLEVSDKVYEVKIALDAVSETYDAEGPIERLNILPEQIPNLDLVKQIIVQKFLGKIKQVPPRFSAIQINGQRAYDLARKGKEFELAAREVELFAVDVLSYSFPELTLRVHCSSGTYIRSLAVDLGRELGVGGYVTDLRRTAIGNLSVEKAVLLKEITAENLSDYLLDGRDLLASMLTLNLREEEYAVMARGNFVNIRDEWREINKNQDVLGLKDGKIVGVVEFCDGGQKLKFKKKFNIV